MKKILSIVMTLILLWGLAMPAAAAEAAVGSTLRLEKTEGTVTVKNASGKSLTLKNGMRLYSGSKIKTDKESYAYISLDNGKAVKLGASSEGEVRKSGKKLELKVLSGELFFDVSVPLEQDESLNIRTSTMVTGVRGTVGYVVVRDRYHSEVCLLEGRLTVTGTDEVSGGIRTTEITAGQKATTVMQQTTQGEQVQLTVEPLKEREVPGFVAVAVAEDTTLQKRIETKSTLDVKKIIEDAQKRLETEQKEAAKEAEEVQRQVEQQAKETQQDQPAQMFTPSSESSGGGGSSYVPPAEVQLSGSTMQADLAAAFASGTPKVTVPAGATLSINEGTTAIPAGKTLELEGTVNIEKGAVLDNSGSININSSESVHVGGTLNNEGMINVGQENAGLLEILESGTLTNGSGAEISVSDGSSFINRGTIQQSGSISAVNTAVVNEKELRMGCGTITSTAGTAIINSGMATISGGLVSGGTCAIANSGRLTLKGDAIVEVTAGSEGSASVISGTDSFDWQRGILKAKSKSYFPSQANLAEITSDGVWFIADYMATTRNLTADRIANLNDILALNHVTAVTLNLGGGSDPVELGQALTVPANKTLTLRNGTLSVGEKYSIVVNGSLVYDNIVNSGNVTVNSGGSVIGTGDFTNNATGNVINNHSFTSGSAFINNGSLTINNNSLSGVKFINGGTFRNDGTVLNNGRFESSGDNKIIYNGQSLDSNVAFTNNSGAELINGGTFHNYAALTNNSGSEFKNSGVFINVNASFIPNLTFWNTGKYTDDTRSSLYLLETATTTGQVQKFDIVGTGHWTQWTDGTTVTLYGNNTNNTTNNTFSLSADDAAGFRTVGENTTVTLDLNGRIVNLGENALTVSGNLTIKDSSAMPPAGTDGTGVLTSSNTTATVIVTQTGTYTLDSGTIENTSRSGVAVKSQIVTEDGNTSNNMTTR